MSNSSKSENFKRLAEKRVNVILDKVRILSNLSNTGLYDYSESDVKKMFEAIEKAIRVAKSSFQKGERETKTKFSFDDK